MKTIYVSAYYHIPKRRIPHMGIARYIQLAPETLRMISGSRLFFYYEEAFIGTLFERLSENLSVDIVPIRRPLNMLPRRGDAKVIAEAANPPTNREWHRLGKEKGISHLRAMDLDGDRQEYIDNLSVWLSKIDLLTEVSNKIENEALPVAWVDVGLAKKNFMRENWNFTLQEAQKDQVIHYSSDMRYCGNTLPLNASFLKAWPKEWKHLSLLFSEKLSALRTDGYPYDEETILSHVVRENPTLFKCLGQPFKGPFGRLRYFYNRILGRKIRN